MGAYSTLTAHWTGAKQSKLYGAVLPRTVQVPLTSHGRSLDGKLLSGELFWTQVPSFWPSLRCRSPMHMLGNPKPARLAAITWKTAKSTSPRSRSIDPWSAAGGSAASGSGLAKNVLTTLPTKPRVRGLKEAAAIAGP